MSEGFILFVIAVALFIAVGPLNLNWNVRVNDEGRHNLINHRFNTPGRNERQRELSSRQKNQNEALEPQSSRKGGDTLRNQAENGDEAIAGEGEVEIQDKGEAVEHPELAQRIIQDVNTFPCPPPAPNPFFFTVILCLCLTNLSSGIETWLTRVLGTSSPRSSCGSPNEKG